MTEVRDSGSQFPLAAQGQANSGALNSIPSIPFRPQAGRGQVIAIGAVSVLSAALTISRAHWVMATKHCWIRTGPAGTVAVAGDFPLLAGAVAVYVPYTGNLQIAVIETAESAALVGNLYIGQSEA